MTPKKRTQLQVVAHDDFAPVTENEGSSAAPGIAEEAAAPDDSSREGVVGGGTFSSKAPVPSYEIKAPASWARCTPQPEPTAQPAAAAVESAALEQAAGDEPEPAATAVARDEAPGSSELLAAEPRPEVPATTSAEPEPKRAKTHANSPNDQKRSTRPVQPSSCGNPSPLADLGAERAVLGAALAAPEVTGELKSLIAPEDFSTAQHQVIWRGLAALEDLGDPTDAITLTARLRGDGQLALAGGPAYLAELEGGVPTTANVLAYARIVRSFGDRRRLLEVVQAVAGDARNLAVEPG